MKIYDEPDVQGRAAASTDEQAPEVSIFFRSLTKNRTLDLCMRSWIALWRSWAVSAEIVYVDDGSN